MAESGRLHFNSPVHHHTHNDIAGSTFCVIIFLLLHWNHECMTFKTGNWLKMEIMSLLCCLFPMHGRWNLLLLTIEPSNVLTDLQWRSHEELSFPSQRRWNIFFLASLGFGLQETR